ncbi:hypothetical protein Bca101_068250 [Brassica carinata]
MALRPCFEVVFVSGDEDEDSFKDYFSKMLRLLEKMKEIKEEEERARREQTLKSVLVTPSRNFVITRDGNKKTAANKTVIPAVSAVKFPQLAVTLSSGKVLKLPVTSGSSEVNAESLVVPKVAQGEEKLSVQRAMLMESRGFTRKIR